MTAAAIIAALFGVPAPVIGAYLLRHVPSHPKLAVSVVHVVSVP